MLQRVNQLHHMVTIHQKQHFDQVRTFSRKKVTYKALAIVGSFDCSPFNQRTQRSPIMASARKYTVLAAISSRVKPRNKTCPESGIL